MTKWGLVLLAGLVSSLPLLAAAQEEPPRPTTRNVLQQSVAGDWRQLDQSELLYMYLDTGRVVIALAPEFAPMHIKNLHQLSSSAYFDGLAIIRSQDNYVVQWGDPDAADEDKARSLGDAAEKLAPEFTRTTDDLAFTPIDSRDAYADEVGFVNGFAAARENERAWMLHCYGALGVGRGSAPDSGNAAALYVVTGHAPRHLDKNISLMGRVIEGMQHLASLPRGTGAMGFFDNPDDQIPIQRIRFGSDLNPEEQSHFEMLRTDTDTFAQYVEARRYRTESWFVDPVGHVGICNVPVPVRQSTAL